ncbi:MAG TPA: UDP-N-acetylmuramate--L-alanine ligase [Elusimicrobiota bacterium]|jgi:UDP-N-acetylmuramate--alanine ligase|nr:UDP-N-acetylmuramate--L-alanine ligase [Elusimicrobiota bacterium]
MLSFVRRVHFVGIGGVGMSGIARVLLNLGYRVQGSDLKETELTRDLVRAGARVFVGHRAANARGADVVVTSSAVAESNPEVREARRLGLPVIARAEMLAELARMKRTVTVAGSHGKTTTTSMTAMALQGAGADPTMVIGGQLANIRSNARLGKGEYLVAEADESDGSFLKLFPLVAVVTNVDDDHLDFHRTMERLEGAFLGHLENLPFYGAAVLCRDDARLRRLIPRVKRRVITYGLGPGADWSARPLQTAPRAGELFAGQRAELLHRGRKVGTIRLRVSGRHNLLNALAAVAAGDFLGFKLGGLLTGLAEFAGVGRRMDRVGRAAGIDILDDYGHHPTEVRATLAAVSEAARAARPRRRVVVVFQPHRYSRTKLLHREFGPAFRGADAVHVMDVYAAGEKPIAGVSSKLILDAVRAAGVPAQPFTRVVDLARELRAGDVVLTLGAGDVWRVGVDLLRRLEDKTLGTL